jgi:hypothetical protein
MGGGSQKRPFAFDSSLHLNSHNGHQLADRCSLLQVTHNPILQVEHSRQVDINHATDQTTLGSPIIWKALIRTRCSTYPTHPNEFPNQPHHFLSSLSFHQRGSQPLCYPSKVGHLLTNTSFTSSASTEIFQSIQSWPVPSCPVTTRPVLITQPSESRDEPKNQTQHCHLHVTQRVISRGCSLPNIRTDFKSSKKSLDFPDLKKKFGVYEDFINKKNDLNKNCWIFWVFFYDFWIFWIFFGFF